MLLRVEWRRGLRLRLGLGSMQRENTTFGHFGKYSLHHVCVPTGFLVGVVVVGVDAGPDEESEVEEAIRGEERMVNRGT